MQFEFKDFEFTSTAFIYIPPNPKLSDVASAKYFTCDTLLHPRLGLATPGVG